MTTTWLEAAPELLLILVVLFVPGLVVAHCLRFRSWDAVALSVPLSLGVVALAIEASGHGGILWGLPIIGGTTVVVSAICLLAVRLHNKVGASRVDTRGAVESGPPDGAAWNTRQGQLAALLTIGAALVGAYAVAHGIGTPHTLNQGYDGAFHVNSINAVARQRLATPGVFASLGITGGSGGFYPPTFGAVAALLVIHTGINPVAAANVTAVAMAVLWPLCMSMVVRRIARPTVFGYAVAMAGAVTIGLFPSLLLRFGPLWPNALSYLALGPMLVVMLRILGLDRSNDLSEPVDRLAWWPCVLAAAIAVPGLFFAHPGALFLLYYLAVPAAIWWGWRLARVRLGSNWRKHHTAVVGTVVFVGFLFVVSVWVSARIPSIESVRHMYWPPHETWEQAVGQVLSLGTALSAPNLAMALLAVLGMFSAAQRPRGRYLLVCYLIVASMAVMTAGIESRTTMRWTGFWYNDPFRLFAALAVIVLPLVALGADLLRSRIIDALKALVVASDSRRRLSETSIVLGASTIVCALVLGLQGGWGTRPISNTVDAAYRGSHARLVSPGEADMFRRLQTRIPAGQTIAGDPFTGAILAGVLSGHPVVYPTFRQVRGDQQLVALRFRDFQRDPAVCAAVQRLHIGVVVTGHHLTRESIGDHARFAGFARLANVPGLTLIDSGGGATAYRVGPCES